MCVLTSFKRSLRNWTRHSLSVYLECVRKAYCLGLTEEPCTHPHGPGRSRWGWCSLLSGSETYPHLQGRGKLCLERKHQDHLSHIFLLFLPNKNIEKIPGDLSHRERDWKWEPLLATKIIQMDFGNKGFELSGAIGIVPDLNTLSRE